MLEVSNILKSLFLLPTLIKNKIVKKILLKYKNILLFIISTLISILISTSVILVYLKKNTHTIPDIIHITKRTANIKTITESLRDEICISLNLKVNLCPIKARAWMFQYDNKDHNFSKESWCMGLKSDIELGASEYIKRDSIPTDNDCKVFLMSKNNSFTTKSEIQQYCPDLASECVFKVKNDNSKYILISCIKSIEYQGISCFAFIDGENLELFKIKNKKSIIELLQSKFARVSNTKKNVISLFPYDYAYE